VRNLEKNRLVKFVSKVMEQSGFKVYENFQTSRHIIDIYGVLPTVLGDVGVVVACKNYDERWEVGLDVLKEMEMVAKTLKASKVVVVTTSSFTANAVNYAGRRNIKLIDKDGLMSLAKKFSNRPVEADEVEVVESEEEEEEEYMPHTQSTSSLSFFKGSKKSLNKGSGGRNYEGPSLPALNVPALNTILSNTISLIIIVLVLSSVITYIVSSGYKNNAIVGVSKIISSAILAYGLVILFEREPFTILKKGTIVFFVSLIIYVILIIVL
jgi:hypothetical protein